MAYKIGNTLVASVPQSANYYRSALIFGKACPAIGSDVFFPARARAAKHKRTLVNVIQRNGAIGIDLDQIRSA